jgi:DNA-binding transcriptional regulator YhcF (GntR family)
VNRDVITIDRASGLPIYLQIRHQLVYEIALGRLQAGAPLPSIRQLAASLRVTTVTVRHAYDALAAENLVVSHPGKGVMVADLSEAARLQVSLRREALAELFVPALNRARALGYSPDEIRAGFQRALASKGRPRVAFVGAEQEFVDHYTPLLAETVRDLGVEVVGVLLRDLKRRGVAALGTEPPEHVATLVRSYAAVRNLLRDTALPVFGLALELSAETRTELLALASKTRAVLVAERVNLTGMAHLIEQYWMPAAPIRLVPLESRALAAALRDAEVVIHSLHARRAVTRAAPSGRRLLELRHDLSPISAARFRDELAASRLAVADQPARVASPA